MRKTIILRSKCGLGYKYIKYVHKISTYTSFIYKWNKEYYICIYCSRMELFLILYISISFCVYIAIHAVFQKRFAQKKLLDDRQLILSRSIGNICLIRNLYFAATIPVSTTPQLRMNDRLWHTTVVNNIDPKRIALNKMYLWVSFK